jgi:hypothetical protein
MIVETRIRNTVDQDYDTILSDTIVDTRIRNTTR